MLHRQAEQPFVFGQTIKINLAGLAPDSNNQRHRCGPSDVDTKPQLDLLGSVFGGIGEIITERTEYYKHHWQQ
jgi:hypothetical protein